MNQQAIEQLISGTPLNREPKALMVGDICIDVLNFVLKSPRVNPEDSAVPLYNSINTEKHYGMLLNYVKVLNTTFQVPRELTRVMPDVYRDLQAERVPIKKRTFLITPGAYPEYLHREDMDERQYEQIIPPLEPCDYDFAVIADYRKGRVTENVVVAVRDKAKVVYVDTKHPFPEMYSGCTVKMNSEEFHRTKPYHNSFYRIVHTMGALGSQVIYPKHPSKNLEVRGSGVYPINVSGAGDVFFATFIGCEQYLGLSELDSLRLATKAAGISIKHIETYIPTFQEVLNG